MTEADPDRKREARTLLQIPTREETLRRVTVKTGSMIEVRIGRIFDKRNNIAGRRRAVRRQTRV